MARNAAVPVQPPIQPPQDPSQTPGNVYYIHSSDGPSSVSITPVLTHSNYHAWARSMRRALGAKNKYDFVDGTIPVPEPFDPSYRAWSRCNMLIHSWIMNSVEESIAQSIVYLENAIDVWEELKERFSRGDFIRISELQIEIYSLKQGTKSVSAFFTALKILWEELEAYLPTPVCNCPRKCVCITGVMNARSQHDLLRTIRFLTGLNDSFDLVRSQILLMDPLPTINKVFSMVIQYERQFGGSSSNLDSEDSQVLINASDSRRPQGRGKGHYNSSNNGSNNGYNSSGFNNSNANSSKKSNKHCTYCGRDNHIVDNCYQKYGFPSHYGRRANANQANVDDHGDGDDARSTRGTDSYGFTKEQYDKLVNLLQTSNAGASSSNPAQVNVVQHHHSGISCLAYSLSMISSSQDNWIIDSGASDHICSSITYFASYHEIDPVQVKMANGSISYAKIAGTVQFSRDFYLHDVLLVTDFTFNLISVSKLSDPSKYIVLFDGVYCYIQEKMSLKMIGSGELLNGLYYLKTSFKTNPIIKPATTIQANTNHIPTHTTSNCSIPSQAIWHFRFGHLSNKRLLNMKHDFPIVNIDHGSICDICHLAKHRKLSFNSSVNKATKCGELLHFDIWGPDSTPSIHNHKYFLTVVDDFSRFTWIILFKSKSEVTLLVQQFIVMIEKQFAVIVKTVRTDNGPEFLMPTFYASKVVYATFIINRVNTPLLQNKSPYTLWFNTLPDIHQLKVFGSLCFASTLSNHRTKLDPRARKCVFLGYKSGMKGVILLDLHSRHIFVSRNVTHYDHILPYPATPTSQPWSYHSPLDNVSTHYDISSPSQNPQPHIHIDTPHDDCSSQQNFHVDEHSSALLDSQVPTSPAVSNPATPATIEPTISPIEPTQSTRKSSRISTKPKHLSDYICNLTSKTLESSSSGILYPISDFHSYSFISNTLRKFAMAIDTESEPTSYKIASQNQHWVDAMDTELKALHQNRTWIYVDKPAHVTPIGNKWVYKIKHKADGSIERYKARLVSKGYNQVEGLDFFDTYSPVAKITTVRTLIALASIQHWNLHQMDVNNAFLPGELQEDVYMDVPQGVTSPRPNQVCKLLKSLYGLKQASRKWYERLTALLLQHGYTQSNSDHSLFTLTKGSSFTALLVYVDDIILAGNCMDEFDRIKQIMHHEFKIKDLGQLRYFLGIEVAHSSSGVTICQRKYCLDLLQDTGLIGAKPASTPLDSSIKLHQTDSAAYEDIAGYRRLVGKLLYLTTSRPDITFAVQQLSQYLASPTVVHYDTACRVVRYLKGSPGRGLFFPRDSTLQLQGFVDADWANCLDTRRSTSGYYFFLGNSLISWRAKKQHTVSRSSSEAEYRALSFASCELQWLLYLLADLHVSCVKPPVLFCDNQSAIHIASNPVFHERTKHLEIDCHFVRDKVQQGVFKLLPISTKAQLADFFTKALPPKLFQSFIVKLGLLNLYHTPACGRVLKLEDTNTKLLVDEETNTSLLVDEATNEAT
ncbi:retrovirus-related Pol polyprotein from transposon TNT 1-94 [Trifolium medium]|uniref:Retrovirus-related Pol polyprotein from transposon TNT 1-94 n=1 Tax=Trifolium medium TaxID=97028 RepID=A0A392LXD3_9FABA|nr:retrovirus-related Pol polyprotein from transposon TNT 1-94 [Trifolium medium]